MQLLTPLHMYYNHEGSLIISHLVEKDGEQWFEDRVYQGYTKREAVVRFNAHLRANGYKKVK